MTPPTPGLAPGTRPTTWFRSPRRSLSGWGVATVIDVPSPWPDHLGVVGDRLSELAAGHEAPPVPGVGPVAFAALPFDRDAAARFLVPAVVVVDDTDGGRWRTDLGTLDPAAATGDTDGDGSPAPTLAELVVRQRSSVEEWCAAVEAVTARIAAGDLVKAVLARRVELTADVDFDVVAIAELLALSHPHALRWCIDDTAGASPELLVSRVGDVVRAQPMAGTTPRTGDPDLDHRAAAELLASSKNREEHQITIDVVHEAILPWCSYLDAEPEPKVVAAGPVQHLATMVEGRLSHPVPSVLELVAALHPTPAVGGHPTATALELIAALEPTGRGRYAGPVGWVDSEGNGAWAVGIRSVEVSGRTAALSAGVGIVADSDPLVELDETRAKFASTLPALMRF